MDESERDASALFTVTEQSAIDEKALLTDDRYSTKEYKALETGTE